MKRKPANQNTGSDVIVALASNCEQLQNLHQAQTCLAQILSDCRFTRAIWTVPYGSTAGETPQDEAETATAQDTNRPGMYLNQLAFGCTSLNAKDFQAALKAIERQMGRQSDERRLGIVRIDLDLLLHGQERFHQSDWERPYVKKLL